MNSWLFDLHVLLSASYVSGLVEHQYEIPIMYKQKQMLNINICRDNRKIEIKKKQLIYTVIKT